MTAGCLPKVYVFPGNDIVPDDIEDSRVTPDIDPLVVGGVPVVNGTTAYPYKFAFMPPGAYTIAFTCADDDPNANGTLTFVTRRRSPLRKVIHLANSISAKVGLPDDPWNK